MCRLTIRRWCMALLLSNILTIRIPIRVTCQARLWHGAQESRSVPLPGALGAAIGAIAIGTVATSISTTTIILTGTTIKT